MVAHFLFACLPDVDASTPSCSPQAKVQLSEVKNESYLVVNISLTPV